MSKNLRLVTHHSLLITHHFFTHYSSLISYVDYSGNQFEGRAVRAVKAGAQVGSQSL
jgi:hypothetical protein